MNIGIVCYPTYGGSGVVATELGKALALRGHKVHFITYKQPARLDFFTENTFYHEVYVSNYPLFDFPPYETALISHLVDVVKFEQLDILHVHYAIPHASAAIMAKHILATEGINIPVITTLHGTDITLVGKDPSFEPVVSYSINMSDGVTSVSESLKQETYSHLKKVTRDIKVIPNFIDFTRFSKQNREHFKKAIAPNGEKLVVHTSNFRKVKRIDDAVKVFAEIIKKMPAKLLLIGDGPERVNIEKLCRDLNLGSSVTFLGKQNQVEEILSVCDLFLMPSETESFGLAALEAMACELPVISSNAGGIPELNVEGVTGFLCDVGNVATMAEKAIYILEDCERLLKFKGAALERAKEFDIHEIVPIYEEYYLEVLKKVNKTLTAK
ncbi:MAG: N-acetyl-alpha-D-glucosaminyl L-malate synthase BshA [Bacteroidia bacterium]|jgi:N-acetyl-alpha-D-glucosaminyl L-malate synthase BshA|nr:N-acetyl-alpha-D-glucosaminyl L-malate synthase BshA [Bacteroidia bacterium]